MALTKQEIAQRIAQELQDKWYVNLGIGIPTLVANYIPKGIDVEFQQLLTPRDVLLLLLGLRLLTERPQLCSKMQRGKTKGGAAAN